MAQAQGGLALRESTGARSWRIGLAVWFTALLVGAVALIPRVVGLADYVTLDEGYHWVGRVRDFTAAIQHQQWARTNLTGHPGVTTMWLGSAGRWLAYLLGVPNEHGPQGLTVAYLGLLRLPLGIANALAVVAGYLLLRRLVRPGAALLGALLWATAPFLIGFGRLLHVDGLVTSFSALSVLMLLAATAGERPAGASSAGARVPLLGRPWFLLGSGVCAGLALVSKSSALVLPPWAGLVVLLAVAGEVGRQAGAGWWPALRAGWPAIVARTAARYLAWLGAALLTFWAIWPAMWVAPRAAIGNVIFDLTDNAAIPHASGNFFLGQPVAVPDWRFYAVVLVLRATPFMLLGLLALPLALRQARGHLAERHALLGLVGWALLFGLAVSFAEKKFDRYLLPAWPELEILAALGLAALGRWAFGFIGGRPRERLGPWLRAAAPLAICAAILAADGYYHPYYMAYYNPLFGGGARAENTILVGWGEGMEQVGAWLRGRPDLARGFVLSWIPPTLQPFVPREIQVLDIRDTTIVLRSPPPNYAVLYARGAWRQESPVPEEIIRQNIPLYTLRRYGITYATIYQMPRPYDTPVRALFDDRLELSGFAEQQAGSTAVITPSWSVLRDMPGSMNLFVHVLAPDGQRVAQVDAPIDDGMFAQWQAGQKFGTAIPIALPPDLPSGAYRVVLGAYRPSDGARLAFSQVSPLPDDVDGPHALLLTTIKVR
jgi:hypothetical protein